MQPSNLPIWIEPPRIRVRLDTGHLLKPRVGREILLPANRAYWPGREFLAWHRQEHGFRA
jgi:hypothetical protein